MGERLRGSSARTPAGALQTPISSSGDGSLARGHAPLPWASIVTNGARLGPVLPALLLGEHNEEVFAAMGLSDAEFVRLRAENVIGEIPSG